MKDQPLILIAEDDPDDQYFFQEAVEVACPRQVNTHFVFDGKQLLSTLREKQKKEDQPKLVVLDLNMQVKDGRKALEDIKSDPLYAGIPVVILTTSDNEEDREYCRQHGATAYYQKPSSIVELVDILRTLCKAYLA